LGSLPRYVIEAIAKRIAGDIIWSSDPGHVIRKWRTIYGLGQGDLARLMGVSHSVISDYERGKRAAGRGFIRKFVNVLLEYDKNRGWITTRRVARLLNIYVEGIIDTGEFVKPLSLNRIIGIVEGIPLTSVLENIYVEGYTILDSVATIQSISGNEFVRIMGATRNRVVVFTGITRGRSVMVATRVSPVKPTIIVLHGIKRVDPLAIRIGIIEEIPVILSNKRIEDISKEFREHILA
jgi:putative transcriptional regulator